MQDAVYPPSLIPKGLALPIMEQFYTIQGEGKFSGIPSYFIRLAGCDVGCVWCDVKESWDAEQHEVLYVQDIVMKANEEGKSNICVITGGEPAMYNLTPLTKGLKLADFRIHIETSGAYEIQGAFDWITVSPKKFKAPLPSVLEMANELKVIVFNKSDLDWAIENAKLVNEQCTLYLQPEWEVRDKVMSVMVDFVKANPTWRISLQNHKYLGVD